MLAKTAEVSPGIPTAHFVGWSILGLALVAMWSVDGLGGDARITLCIFAVATALWVMTGINDTAIALGAVIAFVILEVIPERALYDSLSGELIWLLVASFVIAAALRDSGTAEILAGRVLKRAHTIRQLFYACAAVVTVTAFVIPSTSGRAALFLPVFIALADAIKDSSKVRALALLFPTIILVSAFGSLTGAGAHLIAIEFMTKPGEPAMGYATWMGLAFPVALVCAAAATEVILRVFLGSQERSAPFAAIAANVRLNRQQIALLAVIGTTIAAWALEPVHGVGMGVAALAGALAATTKSLTGATLKKTVKAVEWELLLFLGATLVMGRALIDSGAAAWIAQAMVGLGAGAAAAGPGLAAPAICALVLAIALLSHLVITSRSARAAILIPMVALPMAALGANPEALILVTVAGTGLCQTLAVSSKPVALYAGLERPTYSADDLFRLSMWLLPIMFAAIATAALVFWPAAGVPLSAH